MYIKQCFVVLIYISATTISIPLNSPLPNLSSYQEWLLTLNDPLVNHPRAFEYENKAYTVSTFRARFFEAYHYCQFYKMGLVSVNSAEESGAIHANLKKLGYKVERFWTSGTRLPDGVNWIWLSTGKPVEYTYWGQYEPSGGDETCIELRKGYDLIIWNDVDCFHSDLHLYFICERDLTTSLPDYDRNTTTTCKKSRNELLIPPGSVPQFHFQKPWDNSSLYQEYSDEIYYSTPATNQNNNGMQLKSGSLTLESHNSRCNHQVVRESQPAFRSLPEHGHKQKDDNFKKTILKITTRHYKLNKVCQKLFVLPDQKKMDIFINVNVNKGKC